MYLSKYMKETDFFTKRVNFFFCYYRYDILILQYRSFGKRTGHLNLYTLCSRDGWTVFTLYSRTHLQLIYIRIYLYQVNKIHSRIHTYFASALANSSLSQFSN